MVTDYLTELQKLKEKIILFELKKLEEKNIKVDNMFNEMKHDENTLKMRVIHELKDYVEGNIDLFFVFGGSDLSTVSMVINQPNISIQTLNKIKSIFNCENIIVTRRGDDMIIHLMPNMSDLE